MSRKNLTAFILAAIVLLSFIIKLVLIFKYGNLLTVDSDDLNYVKSAAALIKRGIFVFHNYNEPTVFVMPLYPFFLAAVFKVFGFGLEGLQAARILQAAFSCLTIVLVYLTGKELFNRQTGLISAFLTAFYVPNIVTAGYLLTETLFTTALYLLSYLSVVFSKRPGAWRFSLLGAVWAAAVLIRPAIALYPVILFIYIIFYHKIKPKALIKLAAAMLLTFAVIMSPWWIRNFREYGDFIPLAASSGNPMLQGTYINYVQTPENTVYYKLGENAYETDRIEVETARKRIKNQLKNNFREYIKWYTVGKTKYFWGTVFYWKEFLGIDTRFVVFMHRVILTGFIGMALAAFNNFFRYSLPIMLIIYFNAVHCVYMAFDRYALPLIPILSVFTAYLAVRTAGIFRRFMSA